MAIISTNGLNLRRCCSRPFVDPIASLKGEFHGRVFEFRLAAILL